MPQTRMFRDRMVSMEQTLEGGEKHLELLKALCREAFPEFAYASHQLDHERDLFVMDLAAPDGRRKSVAWTRMVLFDAERIPAIASEPGVELKERLVAFLRARAGRPEIVVTFRHLEEGWADTAEPRPGRRRGRRGGRGGRPAQPGRPVERPGAREAPRPPAAGVAPARPQGREPAAAPGHAGAPGSAPTPSRPGRRRRRRRRRGGGGGPGGGAQAPGPKVAP